MPSVASRPSAQHSRLRSVLLASTLPWAVTSCSPPATSYAAEFLAMGTTVSITVVGTFRTPPTSAVTAARTEIQRLGQEWYPWNDAGELPRANAALAAGKAAAVSPELAALLARAVKYAQQSGGAFDPAVGALVKLWGFDQAQRRTFVLPSRKQIAAWQASHPTYSALEIEGKTLRGTRRDLLLDLGAIGKGCAVDRAVQILREQGVSNALVNAGGNLRAIGRNDGRPWRIAIRDPRAVRALAWLELSGDESVATSGDYERYFTQGGQRWHHLLDPRTGEPAMHTIAVTVLTPDATLADAAATALFVAGPDHWLETARAMGVTAALRVDADGEVQVTRALHARLIPAQSEARPIKMKVVDL